MGEGGSVGCSVVIDVGCGVVVSVQGIERGVGGTCNSFLCVC